MMILRHIETRTRHCRLQDTTNLPTSWSDEQKQNGNDYTFYHNETLSQNGHNSSAMSVNNYSINGSSFGNHGQGFNVFSPTSAPAQSNHNWRGYGNGPDQLPAQNGHFSTWSVATSDYNPTLSAGPSVTSRTNNLMNLARSGNSFQYNMSVGSMSSSSSSSASISPPHDFNTEGSFSTHQLHNSFGASMGSPSLRGMSEPAEPSAFTSFPLLSTAPATSTKGSLVLGNLFQPSNNVTSSLGMNLMMSNMDTLISGLQGGMNEELNSFMGSLKVSSLGSFPGDANPFTTHRNGFPSGDSSPASKSCSLSETSGPHNSPTPRVCKICEEADVVAALVPCGHNLFCMECAEGIVNKPTESERRCPVCKDLAADVLRIRA